MAHCPRGVTLDGLKPVLYSRQGRSLWSGNGRCGIRLSPYLDLNLSNFCISHTYGFAIQTATQPALGDLQALLTAISDWAGGTVQVISRANGFFSPEQIGGALRKREVLLKERSRTNQCIAVDNILQYATVDVPGIDINRDIRWGGECDE